MKLNTHVHEQEKSGRYGHFWAAENQNKPTDVLFLRAQEIKVIVVKVNYTNEWLLWASLLFILSSRREEKFLIESVLAEKRYHYILSRTTANLGNS